MLLKLPGLIDPHVHLRDPLQTEKEDFYTGTSAALAGGYTTVLDMPNNRIPITTEECLKEKIKIAKDKIVCDVGFYFGSLGDNLDEFPKIQKRVKGLKLYLNETTGNFLIDRTMLSQTFETWEGSPILLHAEDDAVAFVIETVRKTRKQAHFCHISTASDLKQIIKAKEGGLPISCGVTPHHLFLTEHDAKILGPFGKMKPPLRSKKDVGYLWKNLRYIDVIESDHAPHTIEEKLGKRGAKFAQAGKRTAGPSKFSYRANITRVPFGVPGLETTLPLFLTAASENRLTIDDIIRLCHTNPARIFRIKNDKETYSEIDQNTKYEIRNTNLETKCKWSPFDGWKVKGKVMRVFIRGRNVFEDGKILAKPGSGAIL